MYSNINNSRVRLSILIFSTKQVFHSNFCRTYLFHLVDGRLNTSYAKPRFRDASKCACDVHVRVFSLLFIGISLLCVAMQRKTNQRLCYEKSRGLIIQNYEAGISRMRHLQVDTVTT